MSVKLLAEFQMYLAHKEDYTPEQREIIVKEFKKRLKEKMANNPFNKIG